MKKKSKQIQPVENKTSSVIIPKPTRKEIISALVLKAKAEHATRLRIKQENMQRLSDTLKKLSLAHLKDIAPEITEVDAFSTSEDLTITIKIPIQSIPAEIRATAKDLRSENENYVDRFYEDTARSRIIHALDNDPARVQALAESPEIEELYQHITGNKPSLMASSE
jgi:hypothetical protein